MLENVKGFDTSDAHGLLVETLTECGYRFEEFLLSPTQFSIPNSRQRYYLIAKRFHALPSCNKTDYTANIHTKVPVIDCNASIFDEDIRVEFVEHIKLDQKLNVIIGDNRSSIEDFLESNLVDFAQFELNNQTLLRYHNLFDLVNRHSIGTNCFTKAYSHRIEGCGSILKTAPDSISYHTVYAEISQIKQSCCDQNEEAIVELLRSLKLRYFTPREIANLMCFPPEFGKTKTVFVFVANFGTISAFPHTINRKQQYRVLGNSVNVLVCYYLLRILLLGPLKQLSK